jgi:hypothetical protein
MTLRATARMSSKSRSNVSTILCSWAALATISGSGSRIRPSSRTQRRRGRPHARLARSSWRRPYRPEISRRGAFEKADLFVSQPGGVLQRLPYISGLKVRIFKKNVLCGHPVRHQIDHKRDSQPHPANAGTTSDYPASNVIRYQPEKRFRKPLRARGSRGLEAGRRT